MTYLHYLDQLGKRWEIEEREIEEKLGESSLLHTTTRMCLGSGGGRAMKEKFMRLMSDPVFLVNTKSNYCIFGT